MSYTLGHQHLKVDQTAVPLGNHFLLITNINIPERNLDQLDTLIPRIQDFIYQEYTNTIPVEYQLTATYTLVHNQTQQTRFWAGSFFPSGNDKASITQFRRFDPDFVSYCNRYLQKESVINTLKWSRFESAWEFSTLNSVVINVQARVDRHHATLQLRQLHNPNNRRYKRGHITFLLP